VLTAIPRLTENFAELIPYSFVDTISPARSITMNTRKPAFPHPPIILLTVCLAVVLGANLGWPAFAQTSTTTTTSTQTSPRLDSRTQAMPDGAKVKDSITAQVPDETTTTYTLTDLLREENKRLKQRIESLEKENAELKAKLSGK